MAKPASRAQQAVWRAIGALWARRSSWALLVLAVLTCLAGCGTGAAASRPCSEGCGGAGFWEKKDDFQLLQQAAGLEEGSWHEAEEELETDDARALWEALAHTGTTLQNFGPRRCLVFVLREVLTRDEDVPYAALLERLRPFHSLAVMRPDGYLVSALTGRPLQRMGRVELREGKLMAGAFEVGAFYRDKGGVFYTVGSSLGEPGTMVGELGLERDWFNAALDGGGDALGEMAQALAMLVHDPIRSLQGLEQLPAAVAALIASSPEYEKFQQAGINIHDPKFGAWWERSSHLKKAYAYNARWRLFLAGKPPPTLEQILQFGRKLAHEYGFQVHY